MNVASTCQRDAFYYQHWKRAEKLRYVLLDAAMMKLRAHVKADRLRELFAGATPNADEVMVFRTVFEMPKNIGADWLDPIPAFVRDRAIEFCRFVRNERRDLIDALNPAAVAEVDPPSEPNPDEAAADLDEVPVPVPEDKKPEQKPKKWKPAMR